MSERGPVIPEGSQAGYDRFHFAPAYRVGDTLYVSGIIGSGESLDEEFASAFESSPHRLLTVALRPWLNKSPTIVIPPRIH